MSAAFKGEGHECPSNAIIDHLIDMSHLLLAINSSANFVIYTWRGRQRVGAYEGIQGSAKRRGLGCINSLPGSAWP